jgi:hypothetical protein
MVVSSVQDAMNRAARAQQRNLRNPARPRLSGQAPGVQVKLVMLFDICRKVSAPNQGAPEGFALRTGTVRS